MGFEHIGGMNVQLKELWNFMQVDMAADNFEAEMRKSPNRQKLLKRRNLLLELQNNNKRIDSEIAVMQDRLEAVRDEAARLEALLKTALEDLQAAPPADMDEAQRKLDSVQKLTDTISRYEQELTKMRKDADSRDRQQKDIRVRAAKAKQEYDQIKAVYDKEYKQDTAKLAEMKKNIGVEAAKQNPELLERYRSIKQHCTPPMARLADGQCCGCFMQLPSATLRTLKEGTLVECDNCGRILYCEEE